MAIRRARGGERGVVQAALSAEHAIVQLKRYIQLDPARAGLRRSDLRVAPLRSLREFETLFSHESDAEP